MTGFEWAVVVLLVLILIKRTGGSDKDELLEVIRQLRAIEQQTSEMRQHLEEVERLTGIAADNLIEMNFSNSPAAPEREF